MEAPIPTSNSFSKIIELLYEGKKYKCKFEIVEESINVSLSLFDSLKFKGNISLNNIKAQLCITDLYINEIFDQIIKLNSDSFSLIQEFDKYILKIRFIIFNREKNLIIDLEESDNKFLSKKDLISHRLKLKGNIKKWYFNKFHDKNQFFNLLIITNNLYIFHDIKNIKYL